MIQAVKVKAFFVLHGEVLTSFKHSFKKQPPKVFMRKAVLKNLKILIEKYLCWSLYLVDLQAYKPATLLQRDSNTNAYL